MKKNQTNKNERDEYLFTLFTLDKLKVKSVFLILEWLEHSISLLDQKEHKVYFSFFCSGNVGKVAHFIW